MLRRNGKNRSLVDWTAVGLVLFILPGCAMVGPQSIRSGRLDYAEAISATEDQQILLAIVKGRYAESSSLLTVSGVAASIRFRVAAGVEAGFGGASPGEDLITGGLAYEENPTITYVPVQSEQYFRRLLAPLPLDILMMSLRSVTYKGELFTLFVNRINNLRNPDFLEGPSVEPNPRFTRFVELFTELARADVLDVFRGQNEEGPYTFLIAGYAPQYYPEVVELLALLDLSAPEDKEKDIVIPIKFAVNPGNSWGIGITTRSTFDLVEIARAAVVVPEEHARAGLAIDYPPMGLPGQGIRINSSTSTPKGRSPTVNFRGYWFYISETDLRTKAFFNVLRAMWSITIAASADDSKVPVLTIPVGR